jgi:hypothetical protein
MKAVRDPAALPNVNATAAPTPGGHTRVPVKSGSARSISASDFFANVASPRVRTHDVEAPSSLHVKITEVGLAGSGGRAVAVPACAAATKIEHPDGSADAGAELLATTVGMSVAMPDFDDAVPRDGVLVPQAATSATAPTTTNPVRHGLLGS